VSRFTTLYDFPPDVDFVRANGVPVPGRADEYRFNCPHCGMTDGKLYVNIKKKRYQCYRGCVRGGFGSIAVIPNTLQIEQIQLKKEKTKAVYSLFSLEQETFESSIVKAYLKSRGIADNIIRSFRLQGAFIFGCFAVAFPVVTPLITYEDIGFRLINHQVLRYYTAFPKKIYGHPSTLTAKELFLMEGPFDVLCSIPFKAIATFGKSPTDEQLSFLSNFVCASFNICLDGSVDEGKKITYAMKVRMITGRDVFIVDLPKDKDPGDLRAEVLQCPKHKI
jgi:hypothetical protein